MSKIKSIKWFKDDTEQMNEKEFVFKLNNISHTSHNGKYHCVIELTNEQKIYSNTLDIKVNCKKFFYKNYI